MSEKNSKRKRLIINIAAVAVGAGIGTLLTACGNSSGDSGTSSAGNTGSPSSVSQSDGVVIKQDYDMSAVSFQDVAFTYDGNPHEILIHGELPEGVLVSYYGNGMTNAGVYTVTAQFQGDATLYNAIPSMTAKLTINKAEVRGITFEDKTYEYDGNPKSVEITGSLPSGVSVTYSGNGMIQPGEYTVVAHFHDATGNYQVPEDMTALMTINRVKVDVPHLEQPSFTYDGKEHEVSILGLDDSLMTITGTRRALDAGAYIISVSLKDRKNYEWSDSSFDGTLRWNILPSGFGAISFDNRSFTYDGEEHSITINGDLPEGVTVSYSNNGQINAGTYQVVAHFTDTTGNYEVPADMTATLTIEKQRVSVPTLSDSVFCYDGSEHQVTVFGFDGNLMTVSGETSGTSVGNYNITVTLKSETNYEWADSGFDGTLSWSIFDYTTVFEFSLNENNEATITKCIQNLSDIVIPEYLSLGSVSYRVVAIGGDAFSGCSSLTRVTIGDSVTSIGNSAFKGCTSLTRVTIGDSVTSIGNRAFYGCTSLTSIVIPDSVTSIGFYAFDGCYRLAVVYNLSNLKIVKGSSDNGYVAYYAKAVYTSLSETSGLTIDSDGFAVLDEGTTKTLIGYFGAETDVTLPSDIDVIGDYAFYNCISLTSVTIGDSVTSIGKDAFRGCSSLTSITIPDSITSIESGAFSGCSSLKRVDITDMTKWCQIDFDNESSNPLYYAHSLWLNGSLVTSIDFQGITEVKDYAFEGCSSLTSVMIPDSVTSIGKSAFSGCSSLTSVVIPDGVTSIGSGAFSSCSSLTSVVIPDSVTSIESGAFSGCSSLTSVVIPDGVTSIGSYAFSGCSSLTSVVIPDSVTSIGGSAFSGCSSLTSITIPDSVTSVGYCTFYNCTSLTSVVIPDSVTSIGGSAFDGCSSLTNVTIGDSVTSIGDYAFSGCSSLTSVVIPDSVTSIRDWAFYGCSSLISVTIGTSVTSIGKYAFYDCYRLAVVYDLSNLKIVKGSSYDGYVACYAKAVYTSLSETSGLTIDSDGFAVFDDGTTKILIRYFGAETDITLPSDIDVIDARAFSGCSSLTSVTIPDSVTSIGYSAFDGCSSLTNVTIGNGVTSIGNYAFDGCTSLSRVVIPDSVTSIGYCAFKGCTSLTSVTIGDSVTSIGDWAFYNCTPLTSVVIPDSVTSIGEDAFYNCTSLTSVVIPDSVTSIGNRAFSGCTSLTSVTIGNSVTSIGSWAFSGCYRLVVVYNLSNLDIVKGRSGNGYVAYYAKAVYTSLSETSGLTIDSDGFAVFDDGTTKTLIGYFGAETDITLPSDIDVIDARAFDGCSSLTSVVIPDSVTSIGGSAFSGCSSLTSITIPDSVTSIGDGAFSGCSSLERVDITDMTKWCQIDFADSDSNPLSYAHSLWLNGSLVTSIDLLGITKVKNYAFYGCTSLTSVTVGNSVTSIGEDAFYNCSSLTSVTIGDSVTSIGDYAFYNCTSLTSVTIGNSVTSIGYEAFYNCSSLTNVTIGNSVTSIGNRAFYGCTSLTSIVIPDSVTSIGFYAFDGCYRLAVVYNLSNLKIVKGSSDNGYVAYYAKAVYTSLSETSGLTIDSDGFAVLDEGTTKTLIGYFGAETDVTLPSDIDVIDARAFSGCSSLTSVVIPDSVTFIGKSAFEGCSSLTSVVIPDSVTSIGEDTFRGCSFLTSVTIGDSVTSIGDYAFSGCTSLTSVVIPDSVTSIGYEAFYNCSSLTSIVIPDSVTSIGGSAFYNCTSLTNVVIPDSVTSIGYDAFFDCTSLSRVTYTGTRAQWNNVSLGSAWKYNCPFTVVHCSDGNVTL